MEVNHDRIKSIILLQKPIRFYTKVFLGGSGNTYSSLFELEFIRWHNFENVSAGNGIKARLNIMITITASPENVQAEVNLAGWECYHSTAAKTIFLSAC